MMNTPRQSAHRESMDGLRQACDNISPITTPPPFCPRTSTMPARPTVREEELLIHAMPKSYSNDMALDLSMDDFILVPPQGATEKFVLRPCASARYSFHNIGFQMEDDLHTSEEMQCTFPTSLPTFDSSMDDYPEVTMMNIVSPPETTGPMVVILEPPSTGRCFNTIEEDSFADFIPIRSMGNAMSDKLSEERRFPTKVPRVVLQPRSRIRTVSFEEDHAL